MQKYIVPKKCIKTHRFEKYTFSSQFILYILFKIVCFEFKIKKICNYNGRITNTN